MAGRDHPRVCGEHFIYSMAFAGVKGSSPRMRGTPLSDAGHGIQSGIIPAYAGNTSISPATSATNRDHPRVCGEHMVGYLAGTDSVGSSPRMRGTRRFGRTCMRVRGIIPAYAGNTLRLVSTVWPSRDHPRVCGEHIWAPGIFSLAAGSSPRMRGTPGAGHAVWHYAGIIPAYAGNTP